MRHFQTLLAAAALTPSNCFSPPWSLPAFRTVTGSSDVTAGKVVFSSVGLSPSSFSSSSSSLSADCALLWDCDGVIADTEALHLQAYNAAWKSNGLDFGDKGPMFWSEEYYDMLQNKVGGGKPKMR